MPDPRIPSGLSRPTATTPTAGSTPAAPTTPPASQNTIAAAVDGMDVTKRVTGPELAPVAPSAPIGGIDKLPLLPIDPSEPCRPDEIMVGTWSAENLFDTVDDPVKDDKEFLPEGNMAYDESKLKAHIDSLSRVIKSVNGGKGPDLLGITEIENQAVGEKLRTEGLADLGYHPIILVEGPDARGVDVALLSRFPATGPATLHPVVREDGKVYRGILEATVDVNGHPMTVFVNHWYATRIGMDPEKTRDQRAVAAKVLAERVDAVLAQDPGREIVMLGDFNDAPGSRVFRDSGLGAAATITEAREKKTIFDTIDALEQQRAQAGEKAGDVQVGTHYYHPGQSWSTFDHLLVSHTLLDESGFAWVPGSTAVVKNDVTADAQGIPKRFFQPRVEGQPNGQIDPTGASDHFPVVMRLRKVGDERRPAQTP